MAIIALESIRLFGYHGLYPEEQEKGNYFRVDVYVSTGNRPLPEDDKIEGTVDYAVIFKVVSEVMGERANLLETLVGRIGKRLLHELSGFDAVKVRVSKEKPPLAADVAHSYVEAEFLRS